MAEYIERESVIAEANHNKAVGMAIADIVDIKEILNNVPAADVERVKHGHWYNRGGRFRCSVCDTKAYLKDVGGTGGWSHEYIQQQSPYCPNCGARMDGE